MSGRDEKGRLKLPKANYIPFQRVQTRSNRGSINNSRQESPEYDAKSSRSRRQYSSTESKRSSRSQSFNVSELGKSPDEDKDGYYFNGDEEDSGKPRRRKSRSRESADEDISHRMNGMSLGNARKNRSHSLSEGQENTKMPYIPFQRVLKIRKRPSLQETDTSFKVPAFTSLRDKRDFRYKYDNLYRTDGYTSEYRYRYNKRMRNQKAKRRPTRKKNESHITEILQEKDPPKWMKESQNDDKSENNDGDKDQDDGSEGSGGSSNGRLSRRGSKHSGDSNGQDDSTTLGHEDRPGSSTPSVRLPQIGPSPLLTGDSARSVNGTGAIPSSSQISTPNTTLISIDQTSEEGKPILVAKLQPVETSRWVEGKGAGRLSQFFHILKSNDEEKPVLSQENVNKERKSSNLQKLTEENDQNKSTMHKNETDSTKPTKNLKTTKESNQRGNAKRKEATISKPEGHVKNEKNSITDNKTNIENHTKQASCQLPAVHSKNSFTEDPLVNQRREKHFLRSKSDSALYYNKRNSLNAHNQILRPNEVIIFNERAITKPVKKGARPMTSLPRIILTMPEDQPSHPPISILEKASHKNVKKGAIARTAIPNLPKIHVQNLKTTDDHRNNRPKSPRLARKNKNNTNFQTNSINSSPSQRVRKKPVISTLHKRYRIGKSQKLQSNYHKNRENNSQHRLKPSSQNKSQKQNRGSKSFSKPHNSFQSGSSKTTSAAARRFSMSNISPAVHQNPVRVGTPIPKSKPQAATIQVSGSYNNDSIKQHISDIRLQRMKRLDRFAHFLKSSEREGADTNKGISNTKEDNIKNRSGMIDHEVLNQTIYEGDESQPKSLAVKRPKAYQRKAIR